MLTNSCCWPTCWPFSYCKGKNLLRVFGQYMGVVQTPVKLVNVIVGDLPTHETGDFYLTVETGSNPPQITAVVENAEPKFVKFPDEMLIKIRDSSLESRNPSGTLLSLLVSEFLYIIYQQKKGTLIVIGLPGYQGVQRAILFEEAQRIGKPRAVRGLRESQDAAVLDGAGLGLGFRPLELYYRTPTTEPYFLEAPTFCFHYRVVSGPHIPTFLARFYRGQPRGGERSRSNGAS